MSTPPTRKAKYCPRCGTMTFPDTVQCATCGHVFHTGVDTPPTPSTVRPEVDPLNRTQMFEMPPSLSARPVRNDDIPTPLDPQPVRAWGRRQMLVAAIAVVVALLVMGAVVALMRHYFG